VEVGADAINFILIFLKYFIRCLNIFHVINIESLKTANKRQGSAKTAQNSRVETTIFFLTPKHRVYLKTQFSFDFLL